MGKKRYEVKQDTEKKESSGIGSKAKENLDKFPDIKDKGKSEEIQNVEKDVEKTKEHMDPEKLLGIEITSDDIEDYIFKGYIEKEINVIKGKFRITLRSLTTKDIMEVNKKYEDFIYRGDDKERIIMKERGDLHRTMLLLSHTVRAVNGNSIGSDPETRFKYFSETLGDVMFNYLVNKHNLFSIAIEDKVRENDGEALKKE